MSLSIALQIDPLDSLNTARDSSLYLAYEAQKRGHHIYFYEPHQLCLDQGQVMADVTPVTLDKNKEPYYALGTMEYRNLNAMDIILMRQDPPYDMRYLTYTYFLEYLDPKVMVLNNPREVRNSPEKLFPFHFKQFMPPTLVSESYDAIMRFFQNQQHTIILKPLYAFGGQDVYHATSEKELKEAYNQLLSKYPSPMVAQQFLANIKQGDKRILLLDGEFLGALNRIPTNHDFLSNMAQGGIAHKTTLTNREKQICDALKPELKKRGLILAGIDVIDGYLTEINTTSPTGLVVIDELYQTNYAALFWDKVEEKFKQTQ